MSSTSDAPESLANDTVDNYNDNYLNHDKKNIEVDAKTNEAVRNAVASLRSSASIIGESPFDTSDQRLNPESPQFSARHWILNLRRFQQRDDDYYKTYTLGVTYRNLASVGNATYDDYQTTVSNIFLKAFSYLRSLKTRDSAPFEILKPLDANINAGDLVVVLGRPGAGCTTLLKTIAAQTNGFHISPDSRITYDGLTQHEIERNFRGEIIYNAEAEIHFPHLTVWQTLNFAAKMRVPHNRIPEVDREVWADHITRVYMAMYGLTHTHNTKVGDNFVRGVSGGERKRVSIAEASICGAPLQCWDNATRGLDAATALEFVHSLRILCDTQDTTVLLSIYQCSQEAFHYFDKVSLLYKGYQIYFGPVSAAKAFFVDMGFECPSRQTDPDFLTSLTSPEERIVRKGFEGKTPSTPEEFEHRWKASPQYAALIKEVDKKLQSIDENPDKYNARIKEGHRAMQVPSVNKRSVYNVSFYMQLKYLTSRSFQRMRNSLELPISSIFGQVVMSLFLGSLFYNLADNTSSFYYRSSCIFSALLFNAFSSFLEIHALYEARPVVLKHRSYALYRPAAEALSSVTSELPVKLVNAIVFNIVVYFMVGLRNGGGHFFIFFLHTTTSTLVMSHLFRFIGAISTRLDAAFTPASVLMQALCIFTGFVIPTANMLGWSRWINYLDPLAYTFEALMVNEYWGREFECSTYVPTGTGYNAVTDTQRVCNTVGAVAGSPIVSGSSYLLQSFDYKHSHLWRDWGIQVAFVIFLLVLYLLCVEANPGHKQLGEKAIFIRSALKEARKKEKNKSSSSDETSRNDTAIAVHSLKNSGDIFHWRNVNYFVRVANEERQLLHDIDGWVKPGTLTALMGASGAGKTTLLDVLASRKSTGVVSGSLFVNGRSLDKSFQRSTGYVQQADLHIQTTTVREALRFSANLRQPETVSLEDKLSYVEYVIDLLDMGSYADAVVGVEGEGLNVEQRKRLTIAVELAARPKLLLFLDEPTSGLDSQTAWSICLLIRKLSNAGQAILCTIHQPSAMLFSQFDNLLFLQPGGRTIYFGNIGHDASTLIDYFVRNGAPECDPSTNPAEWMLEVTGAAPGSHSDVDWAAVWRASPEFNAVQQELDRFEESLPLEHPPETDPEKIKLSQQQYAVSFNKQLYAVTWRVLQQYWRSPFYIYAKIFIVVANALFNGFTFFKSGNSIQGLQGKMLSIFMLTFTANALMQLYLPQFIQFRKLYEARERPSKTFSWFVFMLSSMLAELPFLIICGALSYFCWYYPIGLYNNAVPTNSVHERGALTFLFICVFYIFSTSLSQLCLSISEDMTAAGNLCVLLFTISLIFCGVMQNKDDMPHFWIFLYRVSPMTYYINGMLAAGLANAPLVCSAVELVSFDPPAGQTCGTYMEQYITQNSGYLTNANSTSSCVFCPQSNTNSFLDSISAPYSDAWRNFGIFICYPIFNTVAALGLYWLVRVPHKPLGPIIKSWFVKEKKAPVGGKLDV